MPDKSHAMSRHPAPLARRPRLKCWAVHRRAVRGGRDRRRAASAGASTTRAATAAMDRRPGRAARVQIIKLQRRQGRRRSDPARRCPGLHQRADLCPGQRLSEEMVCRHRRAGEGGELLAQIDPRTYQAALAQAQGQLARDTATSPMPKLSESRAKRWDQTLSGARRWPRSRHADAKDSDLAAKTDRWRRRADGQARSIFRP